ncbi:MAG TPA: fumarylacetoacetase [Gemmatimonadales bacterium]|nr:fumarylacetoacetase [Gemmatimonadales bacterium]
MDHTHDPSLRSWVESADGHRDFPIQNLPLGVFRRRGTDEARVGAAIGDMILDIAACHQRRRFTGLAATAAAACAGPALNPLMALPAGARAELRRQTSELLSATSSAAGDEGLLVPQSETELLVPAAIGDYTDFYASVHHATNVGSMFRPDNPLLPNYKWVPIGYHGRASSIVPSGTAVRRPSGQSRAPDASTPSFGPSRSLDYEMELGFFVAAGNELGETVPIARAEERIFGFCLVNDWSARDLQAWEYQPLGPFLAKNFATTVSPWVVTLEALEPFRAPSPARPAGDPAPLPYLDSRKNAEAGAVSVTVEVYLSSARMRSTGVAPVRLSRGSAADLYWTPAQLLAHHTSNGCNLRPGDLLATGTISGSAKESRGCMLELTWRGAEPLTLPTGETRKFLEDGDEVMMRGYCEREGAVRIGFGECRGVVVGNTPLSS